MYMDLLPYNNGAHRLTVAHARNNVSPKLDSLDPSLIIFQVSVRMHTSVQFRMLTDLTKPDK